MKFLSFLVIAFLVSCANSPSKKTIDPPQPPANVSNRELWIGRSGDELILHPIYASLPLETRKTSTGVEVKSFKNSGGSVSNQSCSKSNYYSPSSNSGTGSGSCSDTRFDISCNHIFYVHKNVVNDYEKVGQCYGDRFDFRPLDQHGNPVVTESEKIYIKELVKYYEALAPASCKLTAECGDGMSCKDNKCQSLGLWGRIANP